MSARNIILYAAAAILLAVSASSCDPGKEGPVATARIETAASTSLGSAKTSLFLFFGDSCFLLFFLTFAACLFFGQLLFCLSADDTWGNLTGFAWGA